MPPPAPTGGRLVGVVVEAHARRLFLVIIAALSMVLALVGFVPAHAANATLTGKVLGPDGAELHGIGVDVYAPAGGGWQIVASSCTACAPDNTYSVSLPPGTYRVHFDDDYHHAYVSEFYPDQQFVENAADVVVGADTVTTINATLAAGAHITGTVGTSGDAPQTGIAIEAYAWDAASSSWRSVKYSGAEAGAAYDLSGLASGQAYRLRFSSCCVHLSEYFPDAKSVDAATSVTAPATGVNATLAPGGQIVGQVTNKDGAPMAGMGVTWQPPPYTQQFGAVEETGPDGRFRIGMLESGSYRVCFYDLREPARVPWECYLHATKKDDTPTVVSVTQGLVTDLGQVRVGVPISTPRVEGRLKVGQVVKIDTDSSIPSSTAKVYRWYAGGKRIKHAKGKRLRLTKALRGKRISVEVYAKGTSNLLLQLKVTRRGRVKG